MARPVSGVEWSVYVWYVSKHILTSLKTSVLVEMQLNELAKSTAVVVHYGPCIAEGLQQWIHLRNAIS